MTFMNITRIKGNADDLLKKKEKVDNKLMAEFEKHGPLEHLVGKTSDGIVIVNIWKTEADSRKMMDKILPVAKEVGLPRPVVEECKLVHTPSVDRLMASV